MKSSKILGGIAAIIGAIFVVVGVVAWIFVANMLSAQQITVAEAAHHDADSTPISLAWPLSAQPGTKMNNPLGALAQAEIIGVHAQDSAWDALEQGGVDLSGLEHKDMTYATVSPSNFPGATDDQATLISAQRTALNQAAGLQSSLFTSVLAFGVSLFAVGTGVTAILLGLGVMKNAGRREEDDVVIEA
ncbi:MAG: hypothetical protein LBH13_05430 [Cellulomonadaceae bacterium]|jgi:hypothetical protein|nr:hypothetical protein [Cellulomonadaceae bacterium]